MVREEAVLRMLARSTGHTFVSPSVLLVLPLCPEFIKFIRKCTKINVLKSKKFIQFLKHLFNFLKMFC